MGGGLLSPSARLAHGVRQFRADGGLGQRRCAEGAVFEEAQEVLAGGPPKRLRYGGVDEMGWEVGLACGGTTEEYAERLAEIHRRLLEALEAEGTVALATRLDGSAHLLAWPGGRLGGPAPAGPGGSCVCPSCGHRTPHVVGEPCYQKKCPKCGTRMVRE